MLLPFHFRRSGRSPVVIAGLAASALFAWTTAQHAVPGGLVVLWGLATLGLVLIGAINPVSGMRISRGGWVLYDERRIAHLPLERIERVVLSRAAAATGICVATVCLTCGGRMVLDPACLPAPRALERRLRVAGIRVTHA